MVITGPVVDQLSHNDPSQAHGFHPGDLSDPLYYEHPKEDEDHLGKEVYCEEGQGLLLLR